LNDLFLQEKNCNSDMKKRGGNPEPPALPLPLFGGILRKNDEVFSMQPRFRTLKTTIRTRLQEPGWDDFAKELDEVPARELVGPLFSCLPLGGEATDRAASALGKAVSRMADEHIEEARNVVRRLMWHMNEESGNIGWGIPEAFAEILAQHRRLGDEFIPSSIPTSLIRARATISVTTTYCAVPAFVPWSVSLWPGPILRPRPGVRFRPVCATKIPFAAKSPEKRWARSACFRGAGGGNGIGGGRGTFLEKGSPPPSLPKTSAPIQSPLQGVRTEKGFPLLGKLFYT
jgi:hypothetical protein